MNAYQVHREIATSAVIHMTLSGDSIENASAFFIEPGVGTVDAILEGTPDLGIAVVHQSSGCHDLAGHHRGRCRQVDEIHLAGEEARKPFLELEARHWGEAMGSEHGHIDVAVGMGRSRDRGAESVDGDDVGGRGKKGRHHRSVVDSRPGHEPILPRRLSFGAATGV